MTVLGSDLESADVPDAFTQAASRYDRMVSLNPGYHRHLRSAAAGLLETLDPHRLLRLVDLGCGSGASTRALLAAARAERADVRVTGVDASGGMLEQARAKRWPVGVDFHQGLAQDLGAHREEWGLQAPADGVLAAYLFRNVVERDAVLADVHALVSDGGTLVVQEYSVAGSPLASAVWTLVSWAVVIPLSWITSRQTRLYRYLWRSVREFDSVQTFVDRLYAAGFVDVEVRTVPGWQNGILHTFRARKPA
ncbi:class I SAM-dependent methyltransferase [Microlunatus flavus]|uniref:Ubiquinone/menaquinone biosynthesis C-methylase UbiE n=1 Tax=Microlunatus flavus TaxID=1036181 RepID=A0A1H8ZER5_9ACTN|nr:class I SAM-dependent methyltransferase [Microlunatus flavus]SEP62198.1 Ubiquinone/menaquinone biosynthesis C-methylase UbiE [Microlunatus flavus]